MTAIRRVLVANRGEIARRVFRACRMRGVSTVAVYSDADADSPYVAEADMAVRLGPADARESYLRADLIIDAALRSGADAIHPGYGFLSENAVFARAVMDAGIVWIGPPPEAILAVGDKQRARDVAKRAGVPTVPGHEGDDDDASLVAAAARIGYPLLVKAAAGGGGKGMRKVAAASELLDAIASARREAEAAFGSSKLILERCIEHARHVEVQLLGDTRGHVVALLERDCSLQRRHQKVIEECPSPSIDAETRVRLLDMGVRIAKAAGYVNAGTAEFILAPDGALYFLEMNTRLQVEHPVTEEVVGVDLVGWQLAIAAGEPLTLRQEDIVPHGHAIEFRLYAEDPSNGFLPQPGRIVDLRLPQGPMIRVDACVRAGMEITGWYDPMIAKIIVKGADREEARRRLSAALSETVVLGIRTNTAWVKSVVDGDAFRDAAIDTTWAERTLSATPYERPEPGEAAWVALAAFLAAGGASGASTGGAAPARHPTPFDATDGFSLVRGGAP